jgi:hypothetical protein
VVRRAAVLLVLGVASASCAVDQSVESIRADSIVEPEWTVADDLDVLADDTDDGWIAVPEASDPVTWEPRSIHADAATFSLAGPQPETEFAIHALVGKDEGWLAVGSSTPPGGPGVATAWHLGPDGTFGTPTPLPTIAGLASVARDAFTTGTGAIVVGAQGVGRESVPSVWTTATGAEWTMVPLPIDMADTHGAIADRIVTLVDGTVVVVGRGSGPFFKELIVWTSRDGGASWTTNLLYYEAFLEPTVATDGTTLVLFYQSNPQPDTGLAGHTSLVVGFEVDEVEGTKARVRTHADVDLTPGARYWPEDLLWDGTQYVMALQADIEAALAVSPDGITWAVVPLAPDGVGPSSAVSAVALAELDGSLVVAVAQDTTLSVHRWDGTGLTRYDTPAMTTTSLAYLLGRSLFAANASQLAYLAPGWNEVSLLVGDGERWNAQPVVGLPLHRNPSRREVLEIVGVADSELALLATGSTVSDGRFRSNVDGAMWRPAGSDTWSEFSWLPDGTIPSVVTTWQESFVVAGYDGAFDWSEIHRLDPITGETTWLAGFAGWVDSIVADASYLYARVRDDVGGSALWWSPDGSDWDIVDLDVPPHLLCSDGRIAVAQSMGFDGERSSLSMWLLDGTNAAAMGSAYHFEKYQVMPEEEQTLRCGMSTEGVMTTLQGFDEYIASQSPQSRLVPWDPTPTSYESILRPLSDAGAWYSVVESVQWSGGRWIAVGIGHDVESSQDALMWTSTDGVYWEQPVTVAGGPGNQGAYTVYIDGPTMKIGGFSGTDAMIWTVPI